MAEEIKALIEKIQQEGVLAGQEKAKSIEDEAKKQAQAIIQKAKAEAEQVIAEAKEKALKTEEASLASLKQAGRNLLLDLRQEINSMLDKIVHAALRQALSPHEMAKIITALIKDYEKQGKEEIIVSMNKDELKSLEKEILAGLKEEVKKGVILKGAQDISGGFLISYDSGKSHFDFTQNALAQHLGQYLKPQLAELLKEA